MRIFANKEAPQITLDSWVESTREDLEPHPAGELSTEPVPGAPELHDGEPTVPEE